jgi:hypothetical protein
MSTNDIGGMSLGQSSSRNPQAFVIARHGCCRRLMESGYSATAVSHVPFTRSSVLGLLCWPTVGTLCRWPLPDMGVLPRRKPNSATKEPLSNGSNHNNVSLFSMRQDIGHPFTGLNTRQTRYSFHNGMTKRRLNIYSADLKIPTRL